MSKHGLRFWHDMATHGPQKDPKMVIFPNALFLHFSWDLPTFSAEGPIPNAKKNTFFTRGPNPKVLIMRWKGPNHRNTLYVSFFFTKRLVDSVNQNLRPTPPKPACGNDAVFSLSQTMMVNGTGRCNNCHKMT